MSENPSAVPTVQIDDATVRVTEWRFAPGATTGWHRHEYPYVVVPMTTGRLSVTGAGGPVMADLVTGRSSPRAGGGGGLHRHVSTLSACRGRGARRPERQRLRVRLRRDRDQGALSGGPGFSL